MAANAGQRRVGGKGDGGWGMGDGGLGMGQWCRGNGEGGARRRPRCWGGGRWHKIHHLKVFEEEEEEKKGRRERVMQNKRGLVQCE